MWIEMNPRFREQLSQYRLAFTCERCMHFDDEQERCFLFFPPEPHREETVRTTPDGGRVAFCKMWEPT